MSVVGRALSGLLEQEYAKQRDELAQELHNALVDVVNEQRPSIETLLFVLELMKAEVLQVKMRSVGAGQPTEIKSGGWREQREKAHGGRIQTTPAGD